MLNKKFMIVAIAITSFCVKAEQILSENTIPATVTNTAITASKPLNKPTVGGRQAGSEQIFGQSATPPTATSTQQSK